MKRKLSSYVQYRCDHRPNYMVHVSNTNIVLMFFYGNVEPTDMQGWLYISSLTNPQKELA